MTQNRCRLFKAVMDTMPSPREEYNFPLPWQNGKFHRKVLTKDLIKEACIKLPKLHKMKRIEENEPEECIELTTMMRLL